MVCSAFSAHRVALIALLLVPAQSASEAALSLTVFAPIVDQTALNADQPDATFAPQDSVRQLKVFASSALQTALPAQALSVAKFVQTAIEELETERETTEFVLTTMTG